MAAAVPLASHSLLLLLLFLLHPFAAQVIVGPQAVGPLDPQAGGPSPPPSHKTARLPFPPRGRSDVPVKTLRRENSAATKPPPAAAMADETNDLSEWQRRTDPTARSDALVISTLSSENLSSPGPARSRPAGPRPRTDAASVALSRSSATAEAFTKGSEPPVIATPRHEAGGPAGRGGPASRAGRGPQAGGDDWQEAGSVGSPSTQRSRRVSMATAGNEMAQFRPGTQTAVIRGSSPEVADAKPSAVANRTEELRPLPLTTTASTSTTPSPTTKMTSTPAPKLTSTPTTTVPALHTPTPYRTSGTTQYNATVGPGRTTAFEPLVAVGTLLPPHSPTNRTPEASTQERTTAIPTRKSAIMQEATQTSAKTTGPPSTTATTTERESTTIALTTLGTGTTSISSTNVGAVGQGSPDPLHQPGIHRNQTPSTSPGHPHRAPTAPPANPTPSPSIVSSPNATRLRWNDLKRTLAFAWDLHVYGSACLFLLLSAGAAAGLALSPGTDCPLRGALALANALLLLAGGLRAAFFFLDPYGTRHSLPRAAVVALYNLPLHLLVWAQAALALLALRVSGVSVLPATLERPPLMAVLAVLQCTLLLAADLLSPALSPVVPVTLQVLSLCWGLAVCLGFLGYVFPRLGCPSPPHPEEEAGRTAWAGSRRTGLVLGRVLAVCALLGALCCGLHVYATVWLYGLLKNWTHFTWGWWLVHFWARLLELAWGFSLLLLASWVFWKPRGGPGREDCGAGDGTAREQSSPCHSAASANRHTCWSKIVQSLKGKPYKKSDSNGVGRGGGTGGGGGGGGGPGELPNNWAGQERPGADISKSLIRNQNHELALAQQRCVKDSNRGRNQRGGSAERGASDGPAGSLLRLHMLGRPPQRSLSGSLDTDKDTGVSLYEFDLRPPSPIDLTRSIDAALHREHLLGGGSLFQPFSTPSPSPSPGSGISQGPWIRRNSDPQMLSESSDTESSMPLGGSIISSVPSRQVTAPPTPSHQGHRIGAGGAVGSVPSSVSCPVSLRPSRTSTGHLGDEGGDDTRPFITPDSENVRGRPGRPCRPGRQGASRSYLEVSRLDDSASVSSEIIDL